MPRQICKICEHPVSSEVETFACPHCQAVSHLACLDAGEPNCPNCGPALGEPAEAAPETLVAPDSPLADLSGELERPKTSPLYRFSLVMVSLAMVLLPAVYLALVALGAWAVGWYAIHFAGIRDFAFQEPLGFFAAGAFYFLPLCVGVGFIFFLVKPFFAPRQEKPEPFSLNHADAPQLFALVGWICRSLDAPIPSRIDVNCSVNARAEFRSGWRSIFGNDMVLVIGLPLAGGMNLSQFAGIIAHEFGHFSQGTAMRAGYVIDRINEWFYRAVHERDQWDAALVAGSERENANPILAAPLYLARLAVWLTRRVLWVLLAAGHALNCFMSRQREFDADRYEFRLSGSENFAGVTHRLRQLNLGSDAAILQIREKWRKERKLFDQIPDFIISRANEIPADAQEKLHAALARRRTRVFDTHPSDAERIQRALAAREPGILQSTEPATNLFADFPGLSRRVTLNYYRGVFGPRFTPECLLSTEQDRARAGHDCAADRENVRRYFLGIASDSRPHAFKDDKSLHVPRREKLLAEIQACRRRMDESLPNAQAAFVRFLDAETRLALASQATLLLEAGFQFDPAEFALADGDPEQAQTDARTDWQAADAELRVFESACLTRLLDTAKLLRVPDVPELNPKTARLQTEARETLWHLSRLGEALGPLLELRRDCAALELLLRYRREQPAADNAAAALENLSTAIQERVNAIQEHTRQLRYPFHHATEDVLVSDYARNKEYHADPVELALREGRSHVEKLLDFYNRLLGNLVMICNEVEQQNQHHV